jgi:YVTN family beta-propeller protein
MAERRFSYCILSVAASVLCAAGLACQARESAAALARTPHLRRPVALAAADGGRWLFTANRRSGAISVIDTVARRTVAEIPVGKKLADLAVTPDGRRVVVVDEEANELIVLARDGGELRPERRVKVATAPVSVRISPDGKQAFVASLWSRRLTFVGLETLRATRTIDLSFAPRKQILISGGAKLVVTDSFGGRLAVVDTATGNVESVRSLPAHNIRGLALSPEGGRLVVSHQALNPLARATRDDIHWGNVITNHVRLLSLAVLLDSKADLLRDSELVHLGDVGRGAGDPAEVIAAADGAFVVVLSGTDEVLVKRGTGSAEYLAVGRAPTAALLTGDKTSVYVANTLADSVSVIDLQTKTAQEIVLGPQPEITAAERGEQLFHDARLAHDRWMSCQSCHTDGHTTGQVADTLADGSLGTPKRILSLHGVGDTGPWAWNGGMPNLETQVRKSIETTMHGAKATEQQVNDLVAFLKTIPPAPALARARGSVDEASVQRGQAVFTFHACANCHAAPAYTSNKTYDVGLTDEMGRKDFNPPSLRGVSQGGPYFHDGRAVTLGDVFSRHRHQIKAELSKSDLDDLLHFLAVL